MSLVLVDSSAWVAFFRGTPEAVERIDPLLADGCAATTGPVLAEILSGARTRPDYQRLGLLFRSLVWLHDPASSWQRVGETRFLLARQGLQVATVDVLIALIAAEAACPLLTRDADFEAIRKVVPLELSRF